MGPLLQRCVLVSDRSLFHLVTQRLPRGKHSDLRLMYEYCKEEHGIKEMKEMERGMVSDKHHATSFSLKKWTGPMVKAANKWFTWNVDGARGNIDTGFPSTFQFLSLGRYNLQSTGGFESSCTSSTHYHGQLYWAWIYEHRVLKPACVAVFPVEFSYLQLKKAGTGVGTYG